VNLCGAVEIIRTFDTDRGQSSDFVAIKEMLMNHFYLAVQVVGDGGWGTSAMRATIGIAVVCDNQTLFDKVINDWKFTTCSSITRYVSENGQTAEAGRDQGHPAGVLDN
jgi:hypothetical protein